AAHAARAARRSRLRHDVLDRHVGEEDLLAAIDADAGRVSRRVGRAAAYATGTTAAARRACGAGGTRFAGAAVRSECIRIAAEIRDLEIPEVDVGVVLDEHADVGAAGAGEVAVDVEADQLHVVGGLDDRADVRSAEDRAGRAIRRVAADDAGD